jgi:hypothetical protein
MALPGSPDEGAVIMAHRTQVHGELTGEDHDGSPG